MKVADMRKKSSADLYKHAEKLRTKLDDKRQSIMTSDDRQVREIRAIRKELAQTLTIANSMDTSEEKK